jgi:ribosomal-protein-alanine N-acetyltransferase
MNPGDAVSIQPGNAVTWRPMRATELLAVASLEARIYPFPWSLGNFRDALAAGYSALVGERDGDIVAYGVMMLAPGEAQVLNLSVAPHVRRRGLGRLLLRRFAGIAAERGVEQLFLEVRESNAPAIALYADEGFTVVARRRDYYPAVEGREDALVMRRELSGWSSQESAW